MNKKRTSQIIETTQKVNGRDVHFLYKITNTRNSYIRLNRDNKILVTVSRYSTPAQMGKFISEHLEKFADAIQRKEQNKLFDETFSFIHVGGERVNIEWSTGSRNKLFERDGSLIGTSTKVSSRKKLIVSYLVGQCNDKFDVLYIECCQIIGIPVIKYRFKWMTSRWGYYSPRDKSVSFSTQLLFHSVDCWKYVIIHELCHTIHLDHSRQFWNLVQTHCPDYKNIKNVLNQKSKI